MPAWDGNYSRDMTPASRRKQYARNLAQQGKEVADADTNDESALQYEKLRTFIEKLGGEAFFFEDAFKIIGDGASNDVGVGLGSGFIKGHEAYLAAQVRYKNLGANFEEKNLHSVSTALSATLLTDTAMKWTVNELVGRVLYPDITSATGFTVISNTATTITVTGNMTTVAAAGDSYLIAMSTPVGAGRTDAVWLNLYLDEISSAEDPSLLHNLGSGIELDRRMKVRTILQVEQGAATYADYTDADGLSHYLVRVATITRYDGIATIFLVDVADSRTTTTSAGGSLVVTGADMVGGTLDDKIQVETPLTKTVENPGANEDLKLKISSPSDSNQFLCGTSPPTWAVPPAGGGGGGGPLVALTGKTFSPTIKRVLNATYLAVTGSFGASIDFSALSIPVPAGATHVMLRCSNDVDYVSGSGSYAFFVFAGAYTATPASLAVADKEFSVLSLNSGSEANVSDTGSIVVALNDPVNPTGDVTLYFQNVIPGGGSVNQNVSVWVDGFYTVDVGNTQNNVSFAAHGTFGATQAVAVGTGEGSAVKVLMTVEEYDVGAGYDAPNSVFVAPADGKYTFVGRVLYQSVPVGVMINAALGKNTNLAVGLQGTEKWYSGTVVTGNGSSLATQVVATINLAQGDTVALYTTHTYGSSLNLVGSLTTADFGGQASRLEGVLVSSPAGGQPLVGKTFVEVPENLKLLGAVKNFSGPGSISGDFVGSVDLSTLGGTRPIPTGATHALIRAYLDFNVTSGSGSINYNALVGKYDSALTTGSDPNSFINFGKVAASTGATDTSELNATDLGTIIVPIAALSPHITWYLDGSGGGTVTLLTLTLSIDGFYVTDQGSLPKSAILQGKTYLPIHKRVFNVGATAPATRSKGSLNLSTLTGTTVPPNATHALIRVGVKLDDTSTSVAMLVKAFLSANSVDPLGPAPEIAEATVDNLVVDPELLAVSGARNEFQTSSVIVPINVATPHVYYWIGSPAAYSGSGTYRADIWVEAYLVDDAGASPVFPGFRFVSGLSHATGLNHLLYSTGTPPQNYAYTLAGFASTDPLFDITKVVGVFVQHQTDSDSADMQVLAIYPDGVYRTLGGMDQVLVGDDRSGYGVTMVPLNKSQSSFTMRLTFTGASGIGGTDKAEYTIIGFWQYL